MSQPGLNGRTIIGELIRNMELARFEMAYSVLLPRVFTVYLHAEDHARLKGVFELIAQDAQRASPKHLHHYHVPDEYNLLRSQFHRDVYRRQSVSAPRRVAKS